MKNEMMWGILLHLSTHIWHDLGNPSGSLYVVPNPEDVNGVDPVIWDEVIANLPRYGINTVVIDMGDAVIYDSHPEIAAKDAWTKEFFAKKLEEIRALGMTPIPKLNFSTAHDRWLKEYSRMISSSIYYQVCADLIQEISEMFDHPSYFHLGWDEESENYQRYKDLVIIRNEKLWWHDLNFLCKECEKNGARPWIWANTSYFKYPNSFVENLPKSCIVTNGHHGTYYSRHATPENQKKSEPYYRAHHFYNDNGYDQIPVCSLWSGRFNPLQTLSIAKNELNPDLIKGFLMAPWYFVSRGDRHAILWAAERLLCAREKVYPETLE